MVLAYFLQFSGHAVVSASGNYSVVSLIISSLSLLCSHLAELQYLDVYFLDFPLVLLSFLFSISVSCFALLSYIFNPSGGTQGKFMLFLIVLKIVME